MITSQVPHLAILIVDDEPRLLRSYARFLPEFVAEVHRVLEDHYTNFEIVLERTQRMVQAGREKLQGPVLTVHDQPREDASTEEEQAFFDQDQE